MTSPLAAAIAAGDAGAATELLVVTVAGVAPVVVDIAGTRVAVPAALDTYSPRAGDTAVLLRRAGRLVLVGSINSRPTRGTVTLAPPGATLEVNAPPLGKIRAAFLASYAPTVADAVFLAWLGDTPVVLGKVGMVPAIPVGAATAPPPALPGEGQFTAPAVAAATWRDGALRDDANGDIIQGTAPGYPGANVGAFFYGPGLSSTLAGATITAAEIYLDRTQGGTFAAVGIHLQRHDATNPATTQPAFTGAITDLSLAVGSAAWFTLPASLAQSLIAGGGLGIRLDSYARLTRLADSPQNGALRLTWRR